MSLYYDTSYPPSLWGIYSDGRDNANTGESFTERAITAQNALNAGKLAGLGFVASPLTAWTTGQSILINGSFRFYWNATAWVAGISATAERAVGEPVQEPQDEPEAPQAPPVAPEPTEPPTEPPTETERTNE